jgi:hypothetical protein
LPTLLQRLERRTAPPAHAGDCWQWQGTGTRTGYGQIRVGGKGTPMAYVHRIAYELMVGPVPEGMEVDHLCFNRGCLNPEHLEPVTRAENHRRRRGRPYRPQNLGETCRHGHPREGNTSVNANGRRYCVACHREAVRRHRQRALGGQ